MAQSIYAILANLITTTSVPGFGNEIEHTIPENLFPDDSTFENADQLLEWAEDNGYTHALLQKGLQKGLIDARATFKACKKDDVWSPEYGQANVDKMEWTVTKRPNQGNTKNVDKARYADCLQMFGQLSVSGLDADKVKEMVTKTYGAELVKTVINALTD